MKSSIYFLVWASGAISWRWGPGDISFQHNVTELENGNILLFDNGRARPFPPDYSRIIEINPTTDEIEWEYRSDNLASFFSSMVGSTQRLPNGNTLICEGTKGKFFEVTKKGVVVWEYINPFFHEHRHMGMTNITFRAHRYGPDYAGFKDG